MKISHKIADEASKSKPTTMNKIFQLLQKRMESLESIADFEQFEKKLSEIFAAAECEVLGLELSRFDINVPAITIGGIPHRQVLRCAETYFSGAGPVRIERSLYANRQMGEKTVCPMELRSGIVEGRWTPIAAKQSSWVVAHLTPNDGAELFRQFGRLSPSKSILDRLPKKLSQRWEENRVDFEQSLRLDEKVPSDASTVAVSLDGVLVPMKDGQRREKRLAANEKGKRKRGPAGYQEVGCGTLSFYNKEGGRLSTIRLARMPESHKATLKSMLSDELESVFLQRPDLYLVKLADGAKDNWTYLDDELPDDVSLVDFFHAAEHLKLALDIAHGEGTLKSKSGFEKYRLILRDDDQGVEKVIRHFNYHYRKHPRRKKLLREIKYFRHNRHRMRYADARSKNLPIGSGVVEAACKTLATQRLKRSGMRWRHDGGQAILTLRSLLQSDRFDRAWKLLGATYKARVSVPENVVALSDWR